MSIDNLPILQFPLPMEMKIMGTAIVNTKEDSRIFYVVGRSDYPSVEAQEMGKRYPCLIVDTRFKPKSPNVSKTDYGTTKIIPFDDIKGYQFTKC